MKLNVSIEGFNVQNEMPCSWTVEDYRKLLKVLEFDGFEALADAELSGYAQLALQELEPEDAASMVLRQMLPSRIKDGQIRNLREDMKSDRLWEEFADMACHESIFNAQYFLNQAFPSVYQQPDVVKLSVCFESVSTSAALKLRQPLDEAFIVRSLSKGMSDHAILNRLFEDALEQGAFQEASQILWQYHCEVLSDDGAKVVKTRIELFSPQYWMGPLEDVDSFEVEIETK